MRLIPALLALLALQEFDYSKVERKIATAPGFISKPQYAVLLIGKETRIWMVLDKASVDLAYPNVLYFDRNANGDLTDGSERIAAIPEEGKSLLFKVGRVEIGGSPKTVLEGVELRSYPMETDFKFRLSFAIKGRTDYYGPFGPGGSRFEFADTPEKAPVLHADPDGPLSFHPAGPSELKRGESTEFMLYVGTRGSGSATFMAVDEEFLDLEKDKLFATVIARDAKGNEIQKRFQLKEHC